MTVYPLKALRALALHTQRLDAPSGETPAPTPDAIYAIVEQLGCVQIDTLSVVARSQYLLMWSRLGDYDPADFDRLIFVDGERRLFEHWRKAASIIPFHKYRYQMPQMQSLEKTSSSWWKKREEKAGGAEGIKMVYERVKAEGPLRSADFKYEGEKRDSWFDWKPTKHALEQLFSMGELMIAKRVNFQRYYDIKERVLPPDVDTHAATVDEARRFHIEDGVRSLGVCRPIQSVEYAYFNRTVSRPHIESLINEGAFVPIQGELSDGSVADLVVHRLNLPLLKRAADGDIIPRRTTFLPFFDSLFWAKGRDQEFWSYTNTLEAYKKKEDRRWGYFCLTILHHDRMVGRFDPKLDRKTGRLIIKRLHLEQGIELEESMIAEIAGAMGDFMRFHQATEFVILESNPPEFGERLVKAMG